MKNILLLSIFCLCVLFLAGCQESAKIDKSVDIVIEDGNQFPESLAGRWKAEDESGWEIVFKKDGSISSAVLALGRFEVSPGKTAKFPMRLNKKSVIKSGKWLVSYSAKDNRLSVEIIIEKFHIEIGDGFVEGSSRDVFDGTVYPDENRWNASWTQFRKAAGYTAENPNTDLSSGDPVYGEWHEIAFNKVVEQ